jgi:hypothetical protein
VRWDKKKRVKLSWRWLSSDRPNDGGSKHLWNVGQFIQDYTAQHPRRQPASYSSMCEPEISPVKVRCEKRCRRGTSCKYQYLLLVLQCICAAVMSFLRGKITAPVTKWTEGWLGPKDERCGVRNILTLQRGWGWTPGRRASHLIELSYPQKQPVTLPTKLSTPTASDQSQLPVPTASHSADWAICANTSHTNR